MIAPDKKNKINKYYLDDSMPLLPSQLQLSNKKTSPVEEMYRITVLGPVMVVAVSAQSCSFSWVGCWVCLHQD